MQEVHVRSGAPAASGAAAVAPAPEAATGSGSTQVSGVGRFDAFVLLASPFAIYFGLTRFGSGGTALLLIGLGLLRIAPVLAGGSRAAARPAFLHAGGLLALAAIVWAVGDGRVALALPVLVNLALLAIFARSLRSGVRLRARCPRSPPQMR